MAGLSKQYRPTQRYFTKS